MTVCNLSLLSVKLGTLYRYALGGTKLALNSKVAWMVGAFQRRCGHKHHMRWIRCAGYHTLLQQGIAATDEIADTAFDGLKSADSGDVELLCAFASYMASPCP